MKSAEKCTAGGAGENIIFIFAHMQLSEIGGVFFQASRLINFISLGEFKVA